LRQGPSTGVLDPLFCRALCLQSGDSQALWLTCDLLGLSHDFVRSARLAIQSAAGISAGNIWISCSHTHSGPATLPLIERGEVDPAYVEQLQERLVEAACRAAAQRTAVTAWTGESRLVGVSENRRQAGGALDATVRVLSLEKSGGDKLAVMFQFACHPTCLQADNRLISADYPGYAMQQLQETTGATAVFLNGAAGDLRPTRRGSQEALRWLGEALATAVHSALERREPIEDVRLEVRRAQLELPYLRIPGEAELEQVDFAPDRPLFYAAQRTKFLEDKQRRILAAWRSNTRTALRENRLPRSAPAEVQVISLGPLGWVGIPGEPFIELAQEIQQRSGRQQHFVCGYTNGALGYIPSPQAYAQGGYEVEEAYILHDQPAPLAPQAGEQIVSTAVKLLAESLHAGR
jgi:neutral ceramidase